MHACVPQVVTHAYSVKAVMPYTHSAAKRRSDVGDGSGGEGSPREIEFFYLWAKALGYFGSQHCRANRNCIACGLKPNTTAIAYTAMLTPV